MAILYTDHKRLVEHVVKRSGVADRDVEDVVHDVFVQIAGALDRFDPESDDGLSTWLVTIAWRTARDHLALHRTAEIPLGSDVGDVLAEDATLETKLIEEEPRALVRYLVGQGDEVLTRMVYGEQTYAQIAKELGIPVTTVQARVRRAYAVLWARLRRRRAAKTRLLQAGAR